MPFHRLDPYRKVPSIKKISITISKKDWDQKKQSFPESFHKDHSEYLLSDREGIHDTRWILKGATDRGNWFLLQDKSKVKSDFPKF